MSSSTRSPSTGPRLHDYAIPASAHGSAGITQLRPGLLGVPTGPSTSPTTTTTTATAADSTPHVPGTTLPVPVPATTRGGASSAYPRRRRGSSDDRSDYYSWDAAHYGRSSYASGSASGSLGAGTAGGGGGGWSLPRSSLRSMSGSSRSGSDAESEPADGEGEGELELVEVGIGVGAEDGLYGFGARGGWKREVDEDEEMRVGYTVREEDEYEEGGRMETWDGMEMEMDMD
jgi:hypothetical protein